MAYLVSVTKDVRSIAAKQVNVLLAIKIPNFTALSPGIKLNNIPIYILYQTNLSFQRTRYQLLKTGPVVTQTEERDELISLVCDQSEG